MSTKEKQVSYQNTNTYETLNQLTDATKNIWIVFHGIGYLSRYFLNYFDELDTTENYIIAPQAPSKYYLKNQYKYVGASWLTKENTLLETQNVLRYLDAVFANEDLSTDKKLIVFGFSQGVSIATRWVASREIKCNHLVLYAGGLPKELRPEDFRFLAESDTKIDILVGDKDQFLTKDILKSESLRIEELFHGKAQQTIFKGGHEVKRDIIKKIF